MATVEPAGSENSDVAVDSGGASKRAPSPVALPSVRTRRSSTLPAGVVPGEVYDTYWRFAAERQAIFFRRLAGKPPPWTADPILARYKFTNAYRASDRVSQYLIRNVIYQGDQSPDELFFRILLFKIFNRIDTWELLSQAVGPITYADYSFDRYDSVLSQAMAAGRAIFSAAYIMPSGRSSTSRRPGDSRQTGQSSTSACSQTRQRKFGESRKHRTFLRLLERMMADETPLRIQEARSMAEVFTLLRSYPLIGDFLAYQYATDLNYSTLTDFSEMEFVVPGPGARSGIRKCFQDLGGLTEAEAIHMVAGRQEEEFARLGIQFESLWGRRLQLIDCQNLFCEVDKYARIAHPHVAGLNGRRQIKQKYRPNLKPIRYWYPPKWGILVQDFERPTRISRQQKPIRSVSQ